MRSGRVHAAVDAYCAALALEPEDADTHALLSMALLAARRLRTARIEAELAVGNGPESPLPLFALARVRTAERRWREAEALFDRLLGIEPEDPQNHLAYAQCLLAQDRRADARRILERARADHPVHTGVGAEFAELELLEGNLGEAERLAREVLAVAPENDSARVVMGHILLRRGDVDAAYEHAVEVLRSDPSGHGALVLLVSVKARRSWALGLWWRYNTWMVTLGDNAYVVLLVAFAVYRFAALAIGDLFGDGPRDLVEVVWLIFALATWFGPALFRRELAKELEPVTLKREF